MPTEIEEYVYYRTGKMTPREELEFFKRIRDSGTLWQLHEGTRTLALHCLLAAGLHTPAEN